MIVLFFIALLFSCGSSSREVTLSCGGDEVIDRGNPGPPGKRGAIGLPGIKGEPGPKGERGQQDESREEIARLENRINRLQRELEETVVLRRNCKDVEGQGHTTSGIYKIALNRKVADVYCDLETDGGGWLLFQRRESGEVDFNRYWNSYRKGFGNQSGEFWLGLDNLHAITSSGAYKLRVDLEDWEGNAVYAEYSSFTVGDLASNFQLSIGTYSGTAGDSLVVHNNHAFSTRDRDNDGHSSHCAARYGAWWHEACHASNLNGEYLEGGVGASARNVVWYHWKAHTYSLKKTEMKIRPV